MHTIEDILAKAPVECISCFCIPPVVLLLVTNRVSGILDFQKPFGGGSKTPDIYGFEVRLHADFPIWKIISLKDGRWSFPIRHLALDGKAYFRSNSAPIPIEIIKMPKRGR
jgi:hypothetical protein